MRQTKRLKYVLRVERNGKGPYHGTADDDNIHDWQEGSHHSDPAVCPWPTKEFVDEFEIQYGQSPLFGFKNWKQAKEWFIDPQELKNLHYSGFRWRWIKTWVAIEIEKQVAFIKVGAKR